MIKEIKEKIISAGRWVKKKAKEVLVALGVIGIAYAQMIQPNGEWTPPEKCFVVTERNFDNIQFEELRRQIDDKFNQTADELSIAYYCYWKYDQSKPFQGYDVLPTLEENKAQFDKLHGLIWHHYTIAFHNGNQIQISEKRIPEEEYNFKYDEEGNFIGRRTDDASQRVLELKNKGIEFEIK